MESQPGLSAVPGGLAVSAAEEQATCPYCSYPLSMDAVTLWDSRRYHRHCVETVAPELLDQPPRDYPVDVLTPADLSLKPYITKLLRVSAIVMAVLIGNPITLICFYKEPVEPLFVALSMLLFYVGIMVVGIAVGCVQLEALQHNLPRTVRLTPKWVGIETTRRTDIVPLSEVRWFHGWISDDEYGLHFKVQPAVVLVLPKGYLACGYSADARRASEAFLVLERRPHVVRPSKWNWILGIATGIVLGGFVGAAVGYLVGTSLGLDAIVWTWMTGFVGAFDGTLMACGLLGASYATKEVASTGWIRSILPFAALGMVFGGAGLTEGLIGIAVNGGVAIPYIWFLNRRLEAACDPEEQGR